jgi:2-polyprenyl-3-methyl-5-hydroxy-6-metoxy-1,4-benzoquinol methylase
MMTEITKWLPNRFLGDVTNQVASRLRRLRSYNRMKYTDAELNALYAQGYWERLEGIAELGHYSLIAGYSAFYHSSPAILDVGCGHGILQMRLAGRYRNYTGIDISSEAIQQTEDRQDGRTCFLACDAAAYVPDRIFDQIIFNEILYYFKDPVGLIGHYVPYLAENGRLIISMYDAEHSRGAWPLIERRYRCEDAVSIHHHASGTAWTVKTFLPPLAGRPV